MNKIFLMGFISILFMSSFVLAENLQTEIKTLGIIGKGIAISSTDPADFSLIKIGVARVSVNASNETREINAGVLFVDNMKFKLKDISIGNGSASANIYQNDSAIGTIKVSSVQKGDHFVWAGTMTLNGKNYNVYLLEVERKIKPVELKDKISDYCKANRNNPNCRERMHEFCENNPDDNRCKEIFREYCKEHLNDVRCRHAVKEFCNNNTDNRVCKILEVKVTSKGYCEEHLNDDRCLKAMQIKETERINDDELKETDDDNSGSGSDNSGTGSNDSEDE